MRWGLEVNPWCVVTQMRYLRDRDCSISPQCWLCPKPRLPCSVLFYKRGAEEPPMWDCLNQTMPWELKAPVHPPHGFPPVVPWVSQSGCWCLLVIQQPQVPSSNSEKKMKNRKKRPLKRCFFSKCITKVFHTLWVSPYQNTYSHLSTLIWLKLSHLSSPLFLVTSEQCKCPTALG